MLQYLPVKGVDGKRWSLLVTMLSQQTPLCRSTPTALQDPPCENYKALGMDRKIWHSKMSEADVGMYVSTSDALELEPFELGWNSPLYLDTVTVR